MFRYKTTNLLPVASSAAEGPRCRFGGERRPIGIDLFAGAGGLTLGFESAGFHVAAAVDIDPIHCATHEFNFPYCATICQSVLSIDGNQIRDRAGIGDAGISVVFGGAPCQGFSMIGKRAMDDPRNALLSHFVRLVMELEPAYFAFENVVGLAIGKQQDILKEMINTFSPRYRVLLPYKILNAADFGVPQNRRRLFLFGAREDHELPSYPEAVVGRTTVRDALSDLPDADKFDELTRRDWVRVKYGEPSSYASKLRGLTRDPSDYGIPRRLDESVLTSSLRTAHTDATRCRFSATTCGKLEPISRLHKLHPDGQSNTIRAGTGSDRGALTSPRPIHPFLPRVVTVREAARLHSYPDWFRFHVTKWHGFRQLGNSVPPLLARAVASRLMHALGQPPSVPEAVLPPGNPALLEASMGTAARYYGVRPDVIPRRCRR